MKPLTIGRVVLAPAVRQPLILRGVSLTSAPQVGKISLSGAPILTTTTTSAAYNLTIST